MSTTHWTHVRSPVHDQRVNAPRHRRTPATRSSRHGSRSGELTSSSRRPRRTRRPPQTMTGERVRAPAGGRRGRAQTDRRGIRGPRRKTTTIARGSRSAAIISSCVGRNRATALTSCPRRLDTEFGQRKERGGETPVFLVLGLQHERGRRRPAGTGNRRVSLEGIDVGDKLSPMAKQIAQTSGASH